MLQVFKITFKNLQHVAVTKCCVKVMLHGTTRNNNFHSFCSSPRSSTLRLNFLFRGPHSFVHKPDSRSFTMRWNRFHWRVKDCSLRKFVKYLRWNRLIFPVRLVVCYSRKGEKRYYKHTVHTNFWSLFGLVVIVQRYDPLNERSQRRGWNSRGVRVIQNWR